MSVAVRKTSEKIDYSALRAIGDVADTLGLPAHVLRFWETRFREIAPVKRAGGRRFYRPRDIELVDAIRRLLYNEGYTIKGVQRILKEQGIDAVLAQVAALDADAGAPPPGGEAPAPSPRIEPRLEAVAPAPPVLPPPSVLPAPTVLPPPAIAPARGEPGDPWRGALAPPPAANEQTPPARLDAARERLLRAALAEIEECRRLLTLTRR
jgi:DNA-binding transcriptional MerR regulator